MTGDRRILTHRQNVVRKAGKRFDNDVIGRDTSRYDNGLVIRRRNRKVDKLAVIVIKEKIEIALAAGCDSQIDDLAAQRINPVPVKIVSRLSQI